MGPNPKTSFIPKQSMGSSPASARRHKTFNVLTFVATIFFLAVLILSVGAFFYKQYDDRKLQSSKEQLASMKKAFEEGGDINSIRELDTRLNIAQYLLDHHIAASRVFDAIEASLQTNATISTFSMDRAESGTMRVALGGEALSFNTVALQEQSFANEKAFAPGTLLFTDVDTTEDDTVKFSVATDLDPASIKYQALQVIDDSTASTTDGSTTDTVPADGSETVTPGNEAVQ